MRFAAATRPSAGRPRRLPPSLRDDYEASAPAVERAVERARGPARRRPDVSEAASVATCSRSSPPDAELPPDARRVRPGPAGRVPPDRATRRGVDRQLAYKNLRTALIAGAISLIIFAVAFFTAIGTSRGRGVHDPERAVADEPAPPPARPSTCPIPPTCRVHRLRDRSGLVGVVINWIITGIGGAIALVAIFLWIRDARKELSELPLEH